MSSPDENAREISKNQKKQEAFEVEQREFNEKGGIEVVYLEPQDNSLIGKLDNRGQAVLLCDVSNLAFTVTLPQVSEFQGRVLTVKKNTASANKLTIEPTLGDTIDFSSAAIEDTDATLNPRSFIPDRVNNNWAII